MSNRRAWVGSIVVAGAMLMAACSSGPSTTAASSGAPGSTTAPATSTGPGANPGSDFCTGLKAESAYATGLSAKLGAAIAAKDFATTKATLLTFFGTVTQGMAQVEASMSGAPADVQAALTVVNQYFSQFQSIITSSTSLQQLETSMASQSNTAQLKAADKVLNAYTKAQCGDLTSPSP